MRARRHDLNLFAVELSARLFAKTQFAHVRTPIANIGGDIWENI